MSCVVQIVSILTCDFFMLLPLSAIKVAHYVDLSIFSFNAINFGFTYFEDILVVLRTLGLFYLHAHVC